MSDKTTIEDRGSIGDKRNNISQSLGKKIVVAIACIGVCAYVVWNILSSPTEQKETAKAHKKQAQNFHNSLAPLELAPADPRAKMAPITLPPPQPLAPEPKKDDPLLDAARRAPVLAFAKGSKSQLKDIVNTTLNPLDKFNALENLAKMNTQNSSALQDTQNFATLLQPTKTEEAKAKLIGNRNFIIAMGTSIPCILETALNSDQPGFASCIINRDILSDNGRVVLLDKGTQVIGEYRGGIKQGQSRLFVLWTRAKTPTGVIIPLASPATDSLGRAGFDGNINTHWWERFGSSLLLTVIDGATTTLTNKIAGKSNKGGSNNSGGGGFEGANNTGKEAASIALENQINIPPTLEKFQGELVNIFVAKDLDFSSVYKLTITRKKRNTFSRSTPSYSFF
ncbi:type IV secretion system protein VirB10 [Bartonella tribocorum]|uniref:Vbh10 protein n=1 Tax=Bartonella tribocorum (strain DSM 28219 / CCUG 45778 / CIP 105476 / IBS 506) TaxID=382640 RepID=A9IYG1_BART1|nr:type IV secretion system protein VirB10 [Bartonella tribocorum]CAK02355.1 Vbh10 protein [Bartonella tribocorum CIP 105476]CDO49693.1 VblB10 protein [Bartonella tribocorum]